MTERLMKDSGIEWIGIMPSEWEVYTNKTIISNLYSGGTPTSSNSEFYSDEGVPFVAIGDMSKTNYVNYTKTGLTSKGIADKHLKVLNKGTILYSIYATIGEVSELNIDACINQAILALFPKEDKCTKQFYKYNLLAMKDFIFFEANGNTQFNLNAEKVKNFKFVVPPIKEQHKIASFLDSKCSEIDSLTKDIQSQIDILEEYKKSVITEVVTKGLNSDVEMKDSGAEGIGAIPKKWNVKRLKFMSSKITDGSHFSPPLVDEGKKYITATNIHDDICDIANANYVSIEDFNKLVKNGCQPRIDDVLLTKDGSVGRTAVVTNNDYVILSSVGIITVSNDINNKYFKYLLDSEALQKQMMLSMAGSALKRITLSKIKEYVCCCPSFYEQKEIALYLESKCSEIDSIISDKKKQLDTLAEYRKSLIYEYVTGKKEVKA